jgi:tRNA A-37 threonylcarbamoyl transferase component Bud32
MIKDIESISSCQQELFKVYLSNGEIYYYKKFLSNCSWWTFDNEPLYEREKHVYQIMRDHGIPIPTAEFVDESQIIITKEVEGVQASQVDSETMHHLIGFWLKKIHKNGYIHGDFHHDNIIFNQKKCDVVILDFEETIQSDKLLYDLATFYRSTFFYFPETGRKLWNSF